MFSEVTLTVLLLLFFCQGLDVSLFREQGERLNTKQRPRLGLIQNYTLELCNTSPAILDSAVVFTAKLRDYSGRLLESDQYEYQWQDMDRTKISHGKFVSSVTRVYRGDCHKQGNYSMTVTVLKDGDRVATSIMLFSLTGELNGNITVKQNLTYHRQEDVLSTDRPIKLQAEIHDKFPSSAQNLAYHWFLNGTRIGISDQPEFSLSLSNPGVQNVIVKVVAKVNTDVFLLPRYVNKSGQFSHSVTLQDPLSRITIKGKDAVAINTRLFINITCHGSGPTGLCWQIFPLGGPPPNVTCSPTVFQANCQHMVNLSIPTAGKYRFVARLDNDVSRTEKQWYMYAYDPGSTNVPAITVPVVFAVLAMAIIVSAAAYIMRLRKKPFVEVADFDFHPSLTRETEGSSLSVRIRRTVQSLVSPRDTGVPRPMRSTFKDYGSVEEDGSL